MTKLKLDKISAIYVDEENAIKTTFWAVDAKENELYTKVVSHDKSRDEYKKLTRTTWSWTTFQVMVDYNQDDLEKLGWKYTPRVNVRLLSSAVRYYVDDKKIITSLNVEVSQSIGKKVHKGIFNVNSETPLSDEMISELEFNSDAGYKKYYE